MYKQNHLLNSHRNAMNCVITVYKCKTKTSITNSLCF